MNAVAAPSRPSYAGPTVRFEAITRQAEKQMMKLSKDDRRKVALALTGTVRVNHCKKLEKFAKHRAFRLAMGRSLRATFQLGPHGVAYVVHIGTHPNYDHFLTRTRGELSARTTPIAKSHVIREATARGVSRR